MIFGKTNYLILTEIISIHDYRNFNSDNFIKAAVKIAEKGYYVIRMGKGVSAEFQSKNNKIIDYAFNFQSDLMDIWLPANCDFMITTGGGLTLYPKYSGVHFCILIAITFLPLGLRHLTRW